MESLLRALRTAHAVAHDPVRLQRGGGRDFVPPVLPSRWSPPACGVMPRHSEHTFWMRSRTEGQGLPQQLLGRTRPRLLGPEVSVRRMFLLLFLETL